MQTAKQSSEDVRWLDSSC